MKIIYLSQLFELDNEFGSDRNYFNCKKLKESGHHVTVITSNISYETSLPKFKTKWFKPIKIMHNGIDIYYVYSPKNFIGNYFKRVLYYISYFIFSFLLKKPTENADIVYAISSPLSVALLGLLLSKRLKAKFYLEITDLWPDVFVTMEYLKNKFVLSLLRKIELSCYQRAKYIIALSRGIQKNIQSKTQQKEKVVLIPNGVDKELFSLKNNILTEAKHLKKKLNLEGKFVCLYLGAHSLYNALNTIIEAANLIKENSEIIFVLIGDGDKKAELKKLAKNYHLNNILFFSPIPRIETPVWLKIADIFLLPNLKGEFYKMNLQNKFFDYLASAKPIIFAGSGESAEIILEANGGKVVKAEDAKAMVNAILELKSYPLNERVKIGKNGRSYVLTHYERNMLSLKLINLIKNGLDN